METSQSNISVLPGTAIILSRLPAQDWFTVEEAARHSGWSRNFVRARILSGDLSAQSHDRKPDFKRGYGKHGTKRIHVDDLAKFIMDNSRGGYQDAKILAATAGVIRKWSQPLQRGLMTYLEKRLQRNLQP
jgi:hypothetical protein